LGQAPAIITEHPLVRLLQQMHTHGKVAHAPAWKVPLAAHPAVSAALQTLVRLSQHDPQGVVPQAALQTKVLPAPHAVDEDDVVQMPIAEQQVPEQPLATHVPLGVKMSGGRQSDGSMFSEQAHVPTRQHEPVPGPVKHAPGGHA
jgi:hypothetical protein